MIKMFDKIKQGILNKSDSYIYYKKQYESLLKENNDQKKEITMLKSENKRLKENTSYYSLKKLLYSKVFLTKFFNLFKESLDEISNPHIEERQCPICGSKSLIFLPVNKRKNALCYNCGSFERQRLIYLYLNKFTDVFSKNNKFLHFAPEECLYNKIIESDNTNYLTCDVEKNDRVKQIIDMCSIPLEDNSYNYIMANHVLEHVPDDIRAMNELYRVVKNSENGNGCVILTVPLFTQYDQTLEKEEYNTDELRLKYYGQKDHVRAYGNDFKKRLENVGFKVKTYTCNDICNEKEIYEYGLLSSDVIFECKK